MVKLALLRHGHTAWNHAGRIQGNTDIPITEESAKTLASFELPKDWQHATLFSSPLSRAHQTATVLTERQPIVVDDLIEMCWGEWEGERAEELLADPATGFKSIEHWGWQFKPPGGESIAEVRDRVVKWAMQLSENSIAVCHMGVMRVLLAVAYDWHFKGRAPFRVKRNRLYVLHVSSENQSLELADPAVVRLVERDDKGNSS